MRNEYLNNLIRRLHKIRDTKIAPFNEVVYNVALSVLIVRLKTHRERGNA